MTCAFSQVSGTPTPQMSRRSLMTNWIFCKKRLFSGGPSSDESSSCKMRLLTFSLLCTIRLIARRCWKIQKQWNMYYYTCRGYCQSPQIHTYLLAQTATEQKAGPNLVKVRLLTQRSFVEHLWDGPSTFIAVPYCTSLLSNICFSMWYYILQVQTVCG